MLLSVGYFFITAFMSNQFQCTSFLQHSVYFDKTYLHTSLSTLSKFLLLKQKFENLNALKIGNFKHKQLSNVTSTTCIANTLSLVYYNDSQN